MKIDRLEVITLAKKGLSAADIAKLKDAGESAIQKIIDEAIQKGVIVGRVKMTQKKRAELRKEIADFVRGGKTVKEAVAKFEVTKSYVKRSCSEHGIELPPEGGPEAKKASGFRVIAEILNSPGESETKIADRLGVSRQYVDLVRSRASKDGLLLAIEKAVSRAVKENGKKPVRRQGVD